MEASERVACPWCAERIMPEAIICPHCQRTTGFVMPAEPQRRTAGLTVVIGVLVGLCALALLLIVLRVIGAAQSL